MKIIATFTDEDAKGVSVDDLPVRRAARVVMFDENDRVALMYVAKDNYFKLPGGGVDEGEDLKLAARRETLEETGYSVDIQSEVGRIDEHRITGFEKPYLQENYIYLGKVIGGKSEAALTELEKENEFEFVWAKNIDDAIAKVESSDQPSWGTKSLVLREIKALQAARAMIA